DVDGQDQPGRHASGHARDVGGGARLRRDDGRADRRQAGWRHPHGQGRRALSRRRPRGGRARVAHTRPVSLRGLLAAEPPPDAASQAAHGPLRRPRLRHARLMSAVPDLVTPTWEYAPAPEARDIVTIEASYGLFIGGQFVESRDGAPFKTVNPATEEVLAE